MRMQVTTMVRSFFVVALFAVAPCVAAQSQPPAMGRDEIAALAKVYVAITVAHDSIDAQRTKSRNKTPQAQQQLQDLFRTQREEILHHAGMTDAEYRSKTFLLSTDGDVRKSFDSVVAHLTGVPTPGQAPPSTTAARTAPVAVPAGPVGSHIGHVINAFSDTPDGMGLLPAAVAEARIAAQHAALAARDPANLVSMQTHAGHVIHALDPTVEPTGPGRGYGVRKASTGIMTHIDLAAKAQGVTQNVITHATHIATSAQNTLDRVAQIIALAQQVQQATSAAVAAPLLEQIVSLTDQLTKGADANADGKIGWEKSEGGLQQAQEHVMIMLAAERG
jgi:hypothetical protein